MISLIVTELNLKCLRNDGTLVKKYITKQSIVILPNTLVKALLLLHGEFPTDHFDDLHEPTDCERIPTKLEKTQVLSKLLQEILLHDNLLFSAHDSLITEDSIVHDGIVA